MVKILGAGIYCWRKIFLEKHTIMRIRGIFCSMLMALFLILFRKTMISKTYSYSRCNFGHRHTNYSCVYLLLYACYLSHSFKQ